MPPLFPTINASLNLTAAIFLLLGYGAVRRKDIVRHRQYMVTALCASALFLVCYLTYHYLHGSTHYQHHGILRIIYFFILLTHTPLAALIVPFIIAAVFFALKGNFTAHVKITRWLWPTWMYVSVTGVIIYIMLYLF